MAEMSVSAACAVSNSSDGLPACCGGAAPPESRRSCAARALMPRQPGGLRVFVWPRPSARASVDPVPCPAVRSSETYNVVRVWGPAAHSVPYRLNCRRASAPLAPARALPVPDSLPHALLARRYLAATGARRRAGFRRLLFRRAALRLASLLSSLQLRVARTGGAGDNCAVLRRTASACAALAWVRLAAVCRWPLPPAGES